MSYYSLDHRTPGQIINSENNSVAYENPSIFDLLYVFDAFHLLDHEENEDNNLLDLSSLDDQSNSTSEELKETTEPDLDNLRVQDLQIPFGQTGWLICLAFRIVDTAYNFYNNISQRDLWATMGNSQDNYAERDF